MNDKEIKDKAIFIVGFLAIFLAISSFKVELSKIYLLMGGHAYSVFHIFIFFVALLVVSVYLYALDYLRYGFGKYQNFILFRAIIPLANFFYSIAILFPILVLLFWIVGSEPVYSFTKQYQNIFTSFDLIGGSLLIVVGIYNALSIAKRAKIEATQAMEKLRVDYLSRAIELSNNKFYGEAVVEVYKVLEQILREKLLKERSLTTKYISVKRLIDMALENQILDKKSILIIKDLEALRNKGVHSLEPISKEDAKFFIDAIKKILENEKFNDWTNE